MKKTLLVLGVCLFMANSVHAALVNVALTGDAVNSDASGFSGSIAGTVDDGFSYDPSNPESALPDQIYSSNGDGWHGDNGNSGVDRTLYYTLSEITIASGDTFVFDFYGASGSSGVLIRDDDFDVALLDGGFAGTVVAEVTGNSNPNSAPYHLQIDLSSGLSAGEKFDTIRVIGHDTDGSAGGNYFTVMEVRAAIDIVPEPSGFMLITLGLAGIGFATRRRRRKS